MLLEQPTGGCASDNLVLCTMQGVRCDAEVEGAHSVPGAGMVATVDGRHVAAGTAALLASRGVGGAEVAAAQRAVDAEGASLALAELSQLLYGVWPAASAAGVCVCMP